MMSLESLKTLINYAMSSLSMLSPRILDSYFASLLKSGNQNLIACSIIKAIGPKRTIPALVVHKMIH